MRKLVIMGQNELRGEIPVQGSKNSVLPILAATLALDGQSCIENCPDITDTEAACDILKELGCKVWREDSAVIVENSGNNNRIPEKLMRKMRSSVMFLGAILAKCQNAVISFPGGCELGPRPIDIHISSLAKMGAVFKEEGGYLYCACPNGLRGAEITLPIQSVGATENIIMAAVKAKGETVILNAAREPEIEDLQNFLNKCGAKIFGAGTDRIIIEGVKKLSGCCHRVIPDRIVAATYIMASAIAGGKCKISQICPNHMNSIINSLKEMNVDLTVEQNSVIVLSDKKFFAPKLIRTAVYPGYPTDAQALIMALCCVSKGSSMFIESIFQSRYKHVSELCRMGANINVEQRVAVVEGVPMLWGANVEATDLRGGAALMIAALAAKGTTVIDKTEHIYRGYEKPEWFLSQVGADIKRIEEDEF